MTKFGARPLARDPGAHQSRWRMSCCSASCCTAARCACWSRASAGAQTRLQYISAEPKPKRPRATTTGRQPGRRREGARRWSKYTAQGAPRPRDKKVARSQRHRPQRAPAEG
jgi:hypothetical protein